MDELESTMSDPESAKGNRPWKILLEPAQRLDAAGDRVKKGHRRRAVHAHRALSRSH
jgi:hypothetical protein